MVFPISSFISIHGGENMGDIIRDGLVMAVSEFTVVLMYIVLSDPIATIIQALVNAGTDQGVPNMTYYHNLISTVLTICFILLAFSPIIWFILRMMSREPDWGYRYY